MKTDIRKNKLKKGEIIPITFDYVFTSIFNNPKNSIILENFLSCYLEIPLEKIKGNIEILSRNLISESKKSKDKQVDLVFNYEGKKINIELNNTFSEGIMKRNIIYACHIHSNQLKYGDKSYSNIEETIQINLNNVKNKRAEKICESYYIQNEKGKILDKSLRIDIINMEIALEKCYTNREKNLKKWCLIFQAKTKEELKKNLGGNIMEKKAKERLEKEVERCCFDKECYALYSAYSREELERNTLLYDARKEAKEEGIKEGIKKGKKEAKKETSIEIARNMLKKEYKIEDIMELTGLMKEELQNLKEE